MNITLSLSSIIAEATRVVGTNNAKRVARLLVEHAEYDKAEKRIKRACMAIEREIEFASPVVPSPLPKLDLLDEGKANPDSIL